MTFPLQRSLPLLAVAACLAGPGAPRAHAHGELHELIEKISREIALKPNNPYLYLNRAELHRGHSDWDAALADLERAEALSNQWSLVHFAKSRLFLSAAWYQSAKVTADRFLEKEPDNLEGLTVRARARVKLADPVGAADDFTRAIAVANPPTPELYLERAQALAAAGAAYHDRALQGIEEGLAKLGPVPTLQIAAIEFEVQWNRVDAALARLDQIMAQAPRKETWLARRGEILRKAGRNAEAAQAFTAALRELEALPGARRTVPAMAELERQIRRALAEIAPAQNP